MSSKNIFRYYELKSKPLVSLLNSHSKYTLEHSTRVSKLAIELGEACNLEKNQIEKLLYAALLHDIGKVMVPNEILNKENGITSEEYNIIKKHPGIGYDILNQIEGFKDVAEITYQHHERIDGKGYPNGLTGDQILIEAKIITITDAFDSMTNSRPYNKIPMTVDDAIEVLQNNKGKQFDAYLVDKFIPIINKSLKSKISR